MIRNFGARSHCDKSAVLSAVFLLTSVFGIANSARSQSYSYPAGVVTLFSVPYTYPGESLATVFGYSPVNLEWWNPVAFTYVTTPTSPADQLHLGYAYWAKFPIPVTLSPGTSASQTQDFTITLNQGWNEIGDPFTVPISISSATFNGVPYNTAINVSGIQGIVEPFLDSWSPSLAAYQTSYTLVPGVGYQLYSFSTSSVAMMLPAPNNTPTQLVISGPSASVPGTPCQLTVQALDANNLPAASYNGTVTFSSTDTAAALPPNTTLYGGQATVSATMATPGPQTITVTSTTQSSFTSTVSLYVGGMALSTVPSCR